MSENVRRTRRELAYQGTILTVYKDYMEFEKSGKTDPVQFLRDDKGYMTISAGERYKHVIYYSNLISEKQKKWVLYYTKQGYNFIDLANDREKLEKGEK